MPEPTSVPGYGPRLRAAAEYVKDCRDRYQAALKARNDLVVDAVDHGYGNHQAARDIGVKQPHIVRILSGSESDLAA
jgi:FixJ family two-component response regulator